MKIAVNIALVGLLLAYPISAMDEDPYGYDSADDHRGFLRLPDHHYSLLKKVIRNSAQRGSSRLILELVGISEKNPADFPIALGSIFVVMNGTPELKKEFDLFIHQWEQSKIANGPQTGYILSNDDIAVVSINGAFSIANGLYRLHHPTTIAKEAARHMSFVYLGRKLDQLGAFAAERSGFNSRLRDYPTTSYVLRAVGRTINTIAADAVTGYLFAPRRR